MSVKTPLLFEKPLAKDSCTPLSHPNPSSQGIRRTLRRKFIKSNLSCRVFGLAQGRAVIRAFIRLAVEINRGFEARRVIWTFSYARIRG
ncbi:hypothetical protein Hanom_Chr09g00796321 [Helianthus anomalus]